MAVATSIDAAAVVVTVDVDADGADDGPSCDISGPKLKNKFEKKKKRIEAGRRKMGERERKKCRFY